MNVCFRYDKFLRNISSNMERDNLTARASQEEEYEKMKKELEGLGVDKPDYTITEMKKILTLLAESYHMANRTENNISNQKKDSSSANNFVSDVTSRAESVLETENEQQKPSCSYKALHNSNSEVPSSCDKQNIKSRRKNTDDDVSSDSSDKNLRCQKSKNSKQEFYNSSVENKLNPKSEQHRNKIRWRINPLDSYTEQDDVPLQQPIRPLAQERVPFRLCKETHTIEKGNKVMDELSIHLKEMADLWLKWHGSTQLKFQWGTPIQVVTANNSPERKPLMVASNFNEVENINDNYKRTRRRKTTWVTNAASSSTSSDDNEEINFSFSKRKRTEDLKKRYKSLHNKEQVTEDTDHLKQELNEQDLSSNNINIIDDKNTGNKSVSEKTQKPNERVVSPELLSNPRRITPLKTNIFDKKKSQSPSLSVKNNKDSNNKDLEGRPVSSRRKHIINTLADEDIVQELDKTGDENNEAILNKNVVIKPLPIVSARLAKQCALLKQAGAERNKKVLAEQKETQRNKDQEKETQKKVFIKKRMEEIGETLEQEEEMQRKDNNNKWLEVLQSRNRTRMQKWKEQKLKETEEQQKETLLRDYDNVQIIEEMKKSDNCLENKVTCPICNKSYPSDKIENHAAMCEQFETDSEPEQNSIYSPQSSKYLVKERAKKSEEIYECNICTLYKTNNGIDYEDHVHNCIKQQGHTPITINIPDSPVRSYQPISEQRNSNIDYSGQLGSVSKAQVGRKRKR